MNRSHPLLCLGLLTLGVLPALAGPVLSPITPASQSVSLGTTVKCWIHIQSGEAPFTFQWRYGGTLIDTNLNPSAAKAQLCLTNVTVRDAGEYTVVVTDTTGPTASAPATLEVDPTFVRILGDVAKGDTDMYNGYWVDLNQDGWLDLVIGGGYWTTGGKRLQVFYNDGHGRLNRCTTNVLATTLGRWSTLVWGDFDNDGSLDCFGTQNELQPGRYFHNTGGGVFTQTLADGKWTANGRAVYGGAGVSTDYDGDGVLDLVAGYWGNGATGTWGTNSVLHGLGDGRFEVDLDNSLARSHTWPETMSFVDYDGDGDQDLFVGTSGDASQRDLLFQNQGDGTFLQITNLPMLQIPALTGGQGWADFDNDGDLDLVVGNFNVTDLLWRNLGNGNFEADPAGPKNGPTGQPEVPQWGDYDNDGYLDLYISYLNGHSRLFHNRGDGTFEEILSGGPSNEPLGYGSAWGDYDNDGFLDLVVVGNGVNYLYRNNLPATGNTNHWLKVKLTGTVSNRDGIGATIRVKATIGGQTVWQRREITSQSTEAILMAHFGLGNAAQVELLRIEWPSGNVQEIAHVPVNTISQLTEPTNILPARPSSSQADTVILRNVYPTGTYQWQFHGVDLPGQTNKTLTLTNLQTTRAGRYSVVVTTWDQRVWTNYSYLTVDSDTTFTRVTTGPLVTDLGTSLGAASADFDHDGFADLLVGRWLGNSALYRNLRNGTFTNDTSLLPPPSAGMLNGIVPVTWGDFNNDGWPDVLMENGDEIQLVELLLSDGGGGFAAPLRSTAHYGWFLCGLDYNHDGLLDRYQSEPRHANELFRNLGNGTFASVKATEAGDLVRFSGHGAVAWVDYNDDGLWEVYSADLFNTRQRIFREDRPGHYVQLTNEITLDHATSTAGAVWGDFDNDGQLDLFVAGWGTPSTLYHNVGNGHFERGAFPTTPGLCNVPTATDYDNDGFLDLFLTRTPAPNLLYHNNGDGSFTQVTTGAPVKDLPLGATGTPGYSSTEPVGFGATWFDYDSDGFQDLFVVNGNDDCTANTANFLYHNNGNSNAWLNIKLQGTESTRDGTGAKVRVQATYAGKERWQRRDVTSATGWQSDVSAHFGLGDATRAEMVKIEWPSGLVQELTNVAKNQLLTIWEPPFLRAAVTAGGGCDLTITAEPNRPWKIEASPDLVQWTELTTITSPTATFHYTDAVGMTCRFYRVVAP